MRDFYKILLLSQSGKGKTYSFRNMNPETTGFLNIENKPLPFKNNFKYHYRPSGKDAIEDLRGIKSTLIEYAKNPEIKVIVFDSFSAYFDILLAHARATKKNFDIWNLYNEEIGQMINLIKRIPKEIFVTGHYEILGIEGVQEKRMKVKGKEWEGLIEKEFSLVFYGTSKAKENGRPDFFFNLYEDGSSSKCPPDIFGEEKLQITNDSNMVFERLLDFTK